MWVHVFNREAYVGRYRDLLPCGLCIVSLCIPLMSLWASNCLSAFMFVFSKMYESLQQLVTWALSLHMIKPVKDIQLSEVS